MSVICTDYNFFIITRDFNIDNNMDISAKELCDLLDTLGLSQHVKGPTHTWGHTLLLPLKVLTFLLLILNVLTFLLLMLKTWLGR